MDAARVIVASHNLMGGRRVDPLAARYASIRDRIGLDVLCLQENRRLASGLAAERVARTLGEAFAVAGDDPVHGVAVLFDQSRLTLVSHELFPLPAKFPMSWFERNVLLDDRPMQICAQRAVFELDRAHHLSIVNFHLDTVGGTRHRLAQTTEIARVVSTLDRPGVVACGDTNAFGLGRHSQLSILRRTLEPLEALGLSDPHSAATHYFARQHEPALMHRIAVWLGRRGFDRPSRYDVVLSDLRARDRGLVHMPESDHDLVWADLAVGPICPV